MSKEQTAVEWFFSELERMQYFIGNDMLQAYKQAKEMEKQQIIDAWFGGYLNGECKSELKSEQYYKENFNN